MQAGLGLLLLVVGCLMFFHQGQTEQVRPSSVRARAQTHPGRLAPCTRNTVFSRHGICVWQRGPNSVGWLHPLLQEVDGVGASQASQGPRRARLLEVPSAAQLQQQALLEDADKLAAEVCVRPGSGMGV